MKRVIITCLLCGILLGYGIYIQYKDYNYSQTLSVLSKQSTILNNNYQQLEQEINNVSKEITNRETVKDTVKKDITTKQDELKKVNDQIKTRQTELAKVSEGRKNQAKHNISNNSGSRVAYLTFDDGPSGYTSRLLDILREYGVKATFFVKGRSDAYSINMYRRIVNEGHTIGNHTYSHGYSYIYSSIDYFDADIKLLEDRILSITGVKMDIMRFPGGSNNTTSNRYSKGIMDTLTVRVRNLGYQYFDWNVSAGDGGGNGTSNAAVARNVINGCRRTNFAIILMHDTKKTTVGSIEAIITSLSEMGFKFLPLTSSTHAIHFK